ncbi:helix-turn-helix domain-containing protein [Pseudooceanicola spongiae]|uniref:Helix-turn-helix domain-containing protein n=1 Tax=Pseudooceanicola spongiae TaxID=2613965 RepID=A0A7L9WRL3_9RHOB|nr:helix-turn-helix domain-containing protein [Pseudooceanicola spongiae]
MITSAQKAGPLPRVPSLRASVFVPILQHIAENGGDVESLLKENGLSAARVDDSYAAVSLQSYLNFFEDAASFLADPMLGARIGMRIRPADLGPIGMLVLQSGSARSGLDRFCRFTNALQNSTGTSLVPGDDCLILTYNIFGKGLMGSRQDSEFSLACLCRLLQLAISPDWRPLEVHFDHAPLGDAGALSRLFRAPVLFGQSCSRLILKPDAIDRVLRPEDSDLIALIERHVASLVMTDHESMALSDKVRSLVSLYLGQRPMTLDVIAAELGMTRRSLQRRLSDEGTSLRELTRAHRLRIAETYLSESSLSMTEVAAALNYADGTVFWRAYRDWTGKAPTKQR